MQSDQKKIKSLLSRKNALIALLLVLFVGFVAMALSNAGVKNVTNADCIAGTPECGVDSSGTNAYFIWIGIYVCSLLGLILMTFKSSPKIRRPAMYVSLGTAAALNTLMWMAIVYAGAYLIRLF